MTVRINLRKKRMGTYVQRFKALDSSEIDLYHFWRRYFGVKFALWAAEQHIWEPYDPKFEPNQNVIDLFEKRLARLAFMKSEDPTMDIERIKGLLDSDISRAIKLAITQGRDITEDNIFYELRT